ncbi:MAG: LysR family transcriptional regulator [Bdellovibrionaceae bacterium]|nr:LysR family transcriptional regulator [Pseudobdellovibrionaceae bacterium]
MNIQQLATFCTVVSEGSMTAAAEKLFLTQPAVSQQIRNLEDEVNCELLVRGVRSVKPTLQGQLLYDYAKRILHLTEQAEVALQAMSNELSGEIRIGTLNSLGLYLISPVIGLFMKHNTKLKIKLIYGSIHNLVKDLDEDQLDVLILPEPTFEVSDKFKSLGKKFLMTDEMWLVGSGRDSSLPQRVALKDYVANQVIYFTDKYVGFQAQLDEHLKAQGLKLNPIFESDNVGTLKRVIETGLGWGFLPAHSIKKQVRTGRLSKIMVEDVRFSTSVNMYYKNTKEVNDIVEVLFRAVRQQALN